MWLRAPKAASRFTQRSDLLIEIGTRTKKTTCVERNGFNIKLNWFSVDMVLNTTLKDSDNQNNCLAWHSDIKRLGQSVPVWRLPKVLFDFSILTLNMTRTTQPPMNNSQVVPWCHSERWQVSGRTALISRQELMTSHVKTWHHSRSQVHQVNIVFVCFFVFWPHVEAVMSGEAAMQRGRHSKQCV